VKLRRPLVIVACHDDLTAGDLVGRYLIQGNDTVWTDGSLTRAVRAGALCYLDEIVEARKDTTVVIHPLADDRRILPVEKRGRNPGRPSGFMLIVSYNPGYQSIMKDLKPAPDSVSCAGIQIPGRRGGGGDRGSGSRR